MKFPISKKNWFFQAVDLARWDRFLSSFLKGISSKPLRSLPSFLRSMKFEFVIFLFLSAWWQRSLFFIEGLPAKYHDSLGTFWLISQSSIWNGFIDNNTGFPLRGRLLLSRFLSALVFCLCFSFYTTVIIL